MDGETDTRHEERLLRQAIHRLTGSGSGGIVTITGTRGTGKTHLLSRASSAATSGTVLTAWSTGSGTSPVYRQLARSLRWTTAPQAAPSRDLATALDVDELTSLAVTDVTALLRAAAATLPLVLVIDDAHLLDTPSAGLVDSAAAMTSSAPLLLVLAWRPDRKVPGALTCLDEVLPGSSHLTRIRLPPLSDADITRIVAATADLDPAATTQVLRVAAGNPLVARELALSAATGRVRSPGAADAIAVLADRVRALDDHGALATLALLGRAASTPLLSAVCGQDADRLRLQVLDAAAAAGLVQGAGRIGQYQLTHPWVAEVVLADLAPPELQARHFAIARALQSRVDAMTGDLTEVAHHLVASGIGGCATSPACLAAALREERNGAFTEAEELAVHGLGAGSPDVEVQVRLLRLLGRCHGRATRVQTARELLERAVQLARERLSPRLFAETVADLASVDQGFTGPWAHRVPLLREALEVTPDPGELRAVLLAHLAGCLYFDDFATSRALAREARDMATRSSDPETMAVAYDIWAFTTIGTQEAHLIADLSARIRHHTPVRSPHPVSLALGPTIFRADRASLDYWVAQLAEGKPSVAQARLDGLRDVVRLARAGFEADHAEIARLAVRVRSSPNLDVRLLAAVADLVWHLLSGEPPTAPRDSTVTVMPTPELARLFLGATAAIRLYHGEPPTRETLLAVTDLHEAFTRAGDSLPADVSMALLAFTAGLLGNTELSRRAVEVLAGSSDRFLAVAMIVPAGPAGFYLAWALRTLGDLHAAVRANQQADACSRRMRAPAWVTHCALQRAELLAPIVPAAAEAAAREAADAAGQLGLAPVAERARTLIGGLRPARDGGSLSGKRHQRILELAAEGLTNEQIARQLFLSVSTVERHFTHIYRTLGVRNRAEAIAAVGMTRPGERTPGA